jgi:serine/threonine-protein kinase
MFRRTLATTFALALIGPFVATTARADSATDKASAEALFDEGRALVTQGKFAQACPKFEASERLDPGVGTMLYLADCYEHLGRTASAWAEFREAVSAAHNAGSLDREEVAKGRAAALEPKLSFLTIVAPAGQPPVVTRDGSRVDPAALGTAMPVDPGNHVIVATAPSKREWSTRVEVGANGARVSVTIPILPDDVAAPAVATAPPATAPSKAPKAEPAAEPGLSTQRVFAILAGGVGMVGLGAGTLFGMKASSSWSDAKSRCSPYPYCGPEGAALASDARSQANASTVLFIVGVAGVVGGGVLWFTAPDRNSEPGVALGAGPGSLFARGRW